MQTIAIVILILFAVSGWAFSIYVNDSWFKDSIKTIDEWYEICTKLNDDWAEHCIELAKKIDELTAEKNKEEE